MLLNIAYGFLYCLNRPLEMHRSTQTATATVEAYPNSALFAAIELPTYILGYPPARVSSVCSCLSVPPITETVTAGYSTVVSISICSHSIRSVLTDNSIISTSSKPQPQPPSSPAPAPPEPSTSAPSTSAAQLPTLTSLT